MQVGTIQNRPHAAAWDREIQAYRDARRQGVQPSGTTMKQVQDAMEISQRTGKAFQADDVMGSIQ